jgi:ankyrin repeat protein
MNARKIGRILLAKAKHSQRMREPALDVPELTIEDVVIGLISSGGKGLNSSELFEFMRAAASKQSDPIASLVLIAEELHGFTQLRPSAWVTQGIDILNTETIVMRNNRFIMSCARNDVETIKKSIESAQEITAMHSELKYTGLHAAADFGAIDALKLLLDTGVSPNIRDARFGQTALHFAAQSGREEVVRVLLEYNADRSTPDLKGLLPRDIANEHGFIMCREMLKDPPPPIMLATVRNALIHINISI